MRKTRLSRGLRATFLTATLVVCSVGSVPVAQPEAPAVTDMTAVRGEVYALLMRAVLSQRAGEYRSAAADVRRATELQPDDAGVLIQGAQLLERMGRVKDAEDLARHALSLDENNVEALWFVADRAAALALDANKPDPKHREEALALYQKLLELGVDDPELLRKLVNLRLAAGDQAGALSAARDLVKRRPGDRTAVGLLAQLLLEGGQAREALRVVVSYVTEHPNDSGLIRLAEELAQQLDAWDVVEEVFAQSEGFEGRAVEAQRLRGQALLRLDRPEPASRALEQVLLTDPNDQAVRHNLASSYLRMGRLGDAAELARGLAQEAPADRGTHVLLAEILDGQGDTEGALNAYNTVLRLYADQQDDHGAEIREAVRRRMILLYLANDQPAAAARLLEQSESPTSPETLQLSARLALAQKDWEAARQAIRALRSAEEPSADLLEAELLLKSDKAHKAAPKIEAAVRQGGGAARVRAAALYRDAGRPEDGERLLRGWVEQEPASTDARFQLGAYLYQAKRFDEADREMREVFRIDPNHAQALNFLGYGYAERGTNLDEALSFVRRALELDPWNGAYLDSLGWVYFRMGRYDDARKPLEQAARTFPHDPTVLDHLGDVYGKIGERELAVAAWNRALEAGADATALRSKIEVIELAEQPDGGTKPDAAGDSLAPKPAPRQP